MGFVSRRGRGNRKHVQELATSQEFFKEVTMKRYSFTRQLGALPVFLVGAVALLAVSVSAQDQNIEGTYKLISRQLPDGTILRSPEIMGLCTYTKTHRNFNIVWKDSSGKFFSQSIVSTYTLTANEYTETLLSSILNDQIGGKDIVYDLSEKTLSVPVKREGGSIQFKLPFEPPSLVFEGDKITATGQGGLDVWQRVP